jgi:hypothetical protein
MWGRSLTLVTGDCLLSALGDVVFIPRDGLMATFAFSLFLSTPV